MLNPHGIANQVLKDSKEFYVHESGETANHQLPISSIDVQGLAYDALLAGAELLSTQADELRATAETLRDRTIELLWQPEREYFALGTDHNHHGALRRIDTKTANPAALLDSQFFDQLSAEQRRTYVSSIVRTIMGPDFLCDAGIRSRALSEAALVPFWDYHGSYTSWPKETYDIAKGLRRQGFVRLATELENRILNVVRKSKAYLEFVYVDDRGRVLAGSPSLQSHGELTMVDSTNRPETIQAWTVSAVLAITLSRMPGRKQYSHEPATWQRQLEQRMLAQIPRVPSLRSSKQLTARYPDYPYRLTRDKSRNSSNFLHDKIG
jgi:glycogen debranching enzyme